MNEKKYLIDFIKHVSSNEFKKANNSLAAVVNEKIKQRIAITDKQLELASKK